MISIHFSIWHLVSLSLSLFRFQTHSTKCFDEFAREHLGSAGLRPGTPPAKALSGHRLASDTIETLHDLSDKWGGVGGPRTISTTGDELAPSLASLPVDARRAFLRDCAAGRISSPMHTTAGAWVAWWEPDPGDPSMASATTSSVYGKRRITTIPCSTTSVSSTSSDTPLDELATLGTGREHSPSAAATARLTSLPPPALRAPPWAASRVMALFDAASLPSITSLSRRGCSSALLGQLATTAFSAAFVWRLYDGDPAGVDAVDATEVLGALAPHLVGGAPGASAGSPGCLAETVRAATVMAASQSQLLAGVRTSAEFAAGVAADVARLCCDRRSLVRILASALELIASAVIDAEAPTSAISDEHAALDAETKLLRSWLQLPGLDVSNVEWRSAAQVVMRLRNGPGDKASTDCPGHGAEASAGDCAALPPDGKQSAGQSTGSKHPAAPSTTARAVDRLRRRARGKAVASAVAAYRKLWFLCIYAASAPANWFEQAADGARTAAEELTLACQEADAIRREASGAALLTQRVQNAHVHTPSRARLASGPQIRVLQESDTGRDALAREAAARLAQLRSNELPLSKYADTVEIMD